MATAKQLAALAKGRAAMAAKRKKKSATKKSVPKKRVKATTATRAKAPVKYIVEIKTKGRKIGYITGHMSADTSISQARKMDLKTAEKVATEFFEDNKKYLTHVRVCKAPK